MAQVRYFAAAAEAAGTDNETLPAATLGELLRGMTDRHGSDLQRVLVRCSLLVDGTRTADASARLTETATVDVLPPFAGG